MDQGVTHTSEAGRARKGTLLKDQNAKLFGGPEIKQLHHLQKRQPGREKFHSQKSLKKRSRPLLKRGSAKRLGRYRHIRGAK